MAGRMASGTKCSLGLWGRRRNVSRSVVMRWPIHHTSDQPGNTRGAIPVRGLQRTLQRLRPLRAARLRWYDMGFWCNARVVLSLLRVSFVAKPSDTVATINRALGSGKNLILTPGIYQLDQSIQVTRPDSVVLGLGFPTLIPENGIVSMTVASAQGMMVAGLIFDAGPTNSLALLQWEKRPRAQ